MDKRRKIRTGTVASNKMQKTVVVNVSRTIAHPRYHKIVSVNKKYYAHSESELEVGQKVQIQETRPLSKLKRWEVVEVLQETK